MPDYQIKKLACDPFDARLTRRHIDRGVVTRAALAKHSKALPDLAAEAEEFTVYLGAEPGDEDDADAPEAS